MWPPSWPLYRGGKTVTLNEVRVAPTSKGRLALAVDFTGDAHRMLLFIASRTIDSVNRQITVPDLD